MDSNHSSCQPWVCFKNKIMDNKFSIYDTCIYIKHPTFPLVFVFLIRLETMQLISKAKPDSMQILGRDGWKLWYFLFKNHHFYFKPPIIFHAYLELIETNQIIAHCVWLFVMLFWKSKVTKRSFNFLL